MDEVYRDYRIAIKDGGGFWIARITHARGQLLQASIRVPQADGMGPCLILARKAVDDYIAYLGADDSSAAE